mmetsp:Transcript_5202/g.8003  ORF Transcript_5202/g.8003 Transcript_5202/m.8003 type:complete len:509 (-) Transcript_5202:172-1698(-)
MSASIFSGYEVSHVGHAVHGKTAISVVVGHSTVYTTGSDNTVALWDINTFVCRKRFKKHKGWVTRCALSPDESYIACCAMDTVYVYALAGELYSTVCEFKAHSSQIFGLAWSPVDNFLATGCDDGSVRLWKVSDLLKVGRPGAGKSHYLEYSAKVARPGDKVSGVDGHTDGVISIAFNFEGTEFLTASKDSKIIRWVCPGHREVSQEDLLMRRYLGHTDEVLSVQWNEVGSRFVSCGKDATVMVWSPEQPIPLVVLRGHVHTVYSAVFVPCVPTGSQNHGIQRIISAGHDQQMRVWHVDDDGGYNMVCQVPTGTNSWTIGLAASYDGKKLVTVTTDSDKHVIFWGIVLSSANVMNKIRNSINGMSERVRRFSAPIIESILHPPSNGNISKHADTNVNKAISVSVSVEQCGRIDSRIPIQPSASAAIEQQPSLSGAEVVAKYGKSLPDAEESADSIPLEPSPAKPREVPPSVRPLGKEGEAKFWLNKNPMNMDSQAILGETPDLDGDED